MRKLVLLFLLSTSFLMAQRFKGVPAKSGGYKIGNVATDFSLKNIDGKTVSLADYKDAKGFIIVFTCNHCPYSVMYEDRIISLDKKYKQMGYPVIAINPNDPKIYEGDSFDKMIIRAKEKEFTFPYLHDDKQQIFPQYGATKTPHVYLLDKNRVVKYIGAIDDNARNANKVEEHFLEDAINALDKGKEINPATTKAIGCSIRIMN